MPTGLSQAGKGSEHGCVMGACGLGNLALSVVVELKATAFKPEHAGQLNFYLSAVDAQVKAADDRPTIGLLLCRQQNRLVAEYALSGIDKPIGVAEYQLLRDLPEDLGHSLPSIAEIEAELSVDPGPSATPQAPDTTSPRKPGSSRKRRDV